MACDALVVGWMVKVPVPVRLPPNIKSSPVKVKLPAAPTEIAPVVVIVFDAPVTDTLNDLPAAVVIAGNETEATEVIDRSATGIVPPIALPLKLTLPPVSV